MTLSFRQENILKKIIKEYIRQAEPISSEYLRRKYKTDLSSATIRNEMQKLTDMGFLYQPHTSAGRVPSDKGYRYLVDLLNNEEIDNLIISEIDKEIQRIKKIKDYLVFLQEINKVLSSSSSGLILSYLPEDNFCLKEGWLSVFSDPEFSDVKYAKNFLSMIDAFEKNIDNLEIDDFTIKIYIGNEFPITRYRDFSILISKCFFQNKKTIFAIAGPKRMPYGKNINIINSIIKTLKQDNL